MNSQVLHISKLLVGALIFTTVLLLCFCYNSICFAQEATECEGSSQANLLDKESDNTTDSNSVVDSMVASAEKKADTQSETVVKLQATADNQNSDNQNNMAKQSSKAKNNDEEAVTEYTNQDSVNVKSQNEKTSAYESAVEDGDYAIVSSNNGGYVADIAGGSVQSGANLQLYEWNGTEAQDFTIQYEITTGTYIIYNKKSGNVLTVAKAASGSSVFQAKDEKGKLQRWKIEKLENGHYKITTASNDALALDLSGGNVANGSKIQVYTWNGTQAQQWKLIAAKNLSSAVVALPEGEKYAFNNFQKVKPLIKVFCDGKELAQDVDYSVSYSNNSLPGTAYVKIASASVGVFNTNSATFTITPPKGKSVSEGISAIVIAANGDYAVDIQAASSAVGAQAWFYSWNLSEAQQFDFIFDEDGNYYLIKNKNSGLYLSATNANSGAKIVQKADEQSNLQRWYVVKNNDAYVFVPVGGNNTVLDLSGGKIANCNNIGLYTWNGTQAQQWKTINYAQVYEALDKLALENQDNLKTDETYLIGSKLSWTKVLDVAQGSVKAGANVQIYDSNMTGAQQWTVIKDSKGYVSFINKGSGLALAVDGAGLSGNNIFQQKYDFNSRAQKWIFTKNGILYSALFQNLAVDVYGGIAANQQNVWLYKANNTAAQNFNVFALHPAVNPGETIDTSLYYVIASAFDEAAVLDIQGGSLSSGALAQIFGNNNTLAQLFTFEESIENPGFYIIRNVKSGKVLEMQNGNLVPTTPVVQNTYNGQDKQLFAIRTNEDGSYSLTNKATALVIDVRNGCIDNGSIIQGYIDNGTTAQKWTLRTRVNMLVDGVYSILSSLNAAKSIDVAGGSLDSGANIQLFDSNDTSAQKWMITAVEGKKDTYYIRSIGSGHYVSANSSNNVFQNKLMSDSSLQQWIMSMVNGYTQLVNLATNKAMDVAGGSTENGTNIGVYAINRTRAQLFQISQTTLLKSGYAFLKFADNMGFVLDVSEGSKEAGANVQVFEKNDSGAQKWVITVNADDTCTIMNARSKMMLDVSSGAAISGANVQQWNANGSAAQSWKIVWNENGSFTFISALDNNLKLSASGSLGNYANMVISSNVSLPHAFRVEETSYSEYEGAQQVMYELAQGYWSDTGWLIMVDYDNCMVGVFHGSMYDWEYEHYWVCSPGAYSTPTVHGTFYVCGHVYEFGAGYSCWYATQFYGNYLIHSVLYYPGSQSAVMDGTLGAHVSHGCVRMAIECAQWIYYNIPYDTPVIVY